LDFFHRAKGGERALLVQPHAPGADAADELAEFTELARSAGAEVLATVYARVDRPTPRFYIGTGKVDELAALRTELGADLVLVNRSLGPVQERNLEAALKCRVVDRTGLILDIFAQRARTHEGKLQVELAQLKHLSTRLVRGWTHLERQRGGAIGLRGPGETQLELDRRMLAERVKALEARLEKVDLQRSQSRRRRERGQLPVVTLVGYTNAGKSTLFNTVTGAGVYSADQLFATLDPTLRKLEGLSSGPAILADTVGFVRDLPHDLVAAFRSTLAEVRDADLLLHVVDAADPDRELRIGQVDAVLADIGADEVPQVMVYNKIDLVEGAMPRRERVDAGRGERVWVSAVSGAGIDLLRDAIGAALGDERWQGSLHLPMHAGRLRARLFAAGVVQRESMDDGGWHLDIDAPKNRLSPLFGLPDGDGEWLRQRLSFEPRDSI
jgi:GTP-binding protein HflX